MTTEQVTLQIAGARVTLPAETLTSLWLDKLRNGERVAGSLETTLRAAPRIGHAWDGQGGIYAGIARGRDLGVDYHLIVADPNMEKINWKDATAWAKGLEIDGHRDFTLPTRSEQALLFANAKELFAEQWYWSSEQSASYGAYAWYQSFLTGNQTSYRKLHELRARAVRRLAIE